LLAVEAAKRAEAGMGADRIADEVEALRGKVSASFVLDTLTYLRRGGLCSGLALFGATILNIKPKIAVVGGRMIPDGSFRGSIERAVARYIDRQLADIGNIRPELALVTHSGFPREALEEVLGQVRSRDYFREIIETTAGCVITSHCGPGTLGILYLKK
jgi:DegV family protein with EDD domain